MSAGPYPTKDIIAPALNRLDLLFQKKDQGSVKKYLPFRQMTGGPQIYQYDDGQNDAPAGALVKTLELSWQNVSTSFDGFLIGTLANQVLAPEDIEKVELLPLSGSCPAPDTQGWLPRQGWSLVTSNDIHADGTPPWLLDLGQQAAFAGTIVGFDADFPTVFTSGGLLRITFAGDGITKLSTIPNNTTRSHSSVQLVAKNAAGEVVADAHPSMALLQRRYEVVSGIVPPQSLPIVSGPTSVQPPTATTGIQGMEIVWPPDGGVPYLHVFRQGSSGPGQEYYLSLTPGLPQ